MISWPVDIIEDIARRRSVLYIGAGVSKNSVNALGARPKDWAEFLNIASNATAKKRLIDKIIKSGDYLTACEVIKQDLGRDNFNTLVRKEFQIPQFQSADIHKHIFNLDSRIVATPNFDKIYDVYADHASNGNLSVKAYYDDDIADVIRRPEPVILKVHGTITTPDRLIFSRKDYSKARTENKNFYQVLDALLLTQTFVFIGCGPNDPDIRLLLEDYNYRFRFNRKHFIISPKNAVQKEVLEIIEDTMSLKTIVYDPKNFHVDLTESLEELVKLVEAKRQDLAASMKW
ncbi:MAG: SIR2 family protein [Sphingobacteriales bacterium]|nr:MAG: SIR2 family protein [Sphingobacteriales bacterium]